MSSIAKQLCDDIVEPGLSHSLKKRQDPKTSMYADRGKVIRNRVLKSSTEPQKHHNQPVKVARLTPNRPTSPIAKKSTNVSTNSTQNTNGSVQLIRRKTSIETLRSPLKSPLHMPFLADKPSRQSQTSGYRLSQIEKSCSCNCLADTVSDSTQITERSDSYQETSSDTDHAAFDDNSPNFSQTYSIDENTCKYKFNVMDHIQLSDSSSQERLSQVNIIQEDMEEKSNTLGYSNEHSSFPLYSKIIKQLQQSLEESKCVHCNIPNHNELFQLLPTAETKSVTQPPAIRAMNMSKKPDLPLGVMGARRWALSKYTKGPDF